MSSSFPRSDYSTEVDRMMATPVMPPEQNGTSSKELKENTNSVVNPFLPKNHMFGSDNSTEVDKMTVNPFMREQNAISLREIIENRNSVAHPFSSKNHVFGTTPHALPSRSENEIIHTAHNSGLMISEQQSLIKAVDELWSRPRIGNMYGYTNVNLEELMKRLKFLSEKPEKLSIDEAIEICDASILLKFVAQHVNINIDDSVVPKVFKTYQESFNLIAQIANNGVLLMLQAKILENKGRELLDLSKSKLQKANDENDVTRSF
ncbi:hypothetical protein P8452_35498 [Trifolium repens]|nr:hypothetical protein P8452_35498 [Trifolium repens]